MKKQIAIVTGATGGLGKEFVKYDQSKYLYGGGTWTRMYSIYARKKSYNKYSFISIVLINE